MLEAATLSTVTSTVTYERGNLQVMTAYGVKKRRHEPGPNFRLAVNKPEAQGSTSLIFQKAQILAFY